MGNQYTKDNKRDLIDSAIQYFRDSKIILGKRTLAKYLVNIYPLIFPDIEQTRSLIRYVTGTKGVNSRKENPNIKAMYNKTDLPESHSEPWIPYTIPNKFKRILILSDIHFPYHDKIALDAAINFGIRNKADYCLLNGDILDCYQLSVFNKRPDKADMSIEFEMVRDFIKLMRKTFKNVLFKTGNHCERWDYFLMRNPGIFSVDQFQLKNILGLKDDEFITDKRVIKAGKLSILHGHEIGKGVFNPVNFARTLITRTGESTIAGHVHYLSNHPFKRLNGESIQCWSQGCLCELNPQYMPLNQWKHGFSFVTLEKNGNFHVQNKEIINGKIY